MNLKYRKPRREDYDTEEDYIDACEVYESALDDYCDEQFERYKEKSQ